MKPKSENIVYTNNRSLKDHEKQMISLISKHPNAINSSFNILDLGAADGMFLSSLKEKLPLSNCTGIDYDSALIHQGQKYSEIKLIQAEISPSMIRKIDEKFDAIILSGFLTMFSNPFELLESITNLLKPKGRVYIFGRFNDSPYDLKIEHRENTNSDFSDTRYVISLNKYRDFAVKFNLKFSYSNFNLKLNLPKAEKNPHKTHTVKLYNGRNILVSGRGEFVDVMFVQLELDK